MENNNDKEVVVSNRSNDVRISKTNDFNKFDNMQDIIDYVKPLVNSSQKRWKSPEDLALAMLTARDLGLPFTTILNKGYVINGVTGIQYQAKRGLVEKAGIILEELEDDKPLYQYQVKGVWIFQDDYERNKEHYIVFNSVEEALEAKNKNIIPESKIIAIKNLQPYDYRTTIKGTRFYRKPDGKGFIEVTKQVSFCFSTAVTAGIVERNPVWNLWRRDMLLSKTTQRICDIIASDVTQGIPTVDELFDNNNIRYEVIDAEIVPND